MVLEIGGIEYTCCPFNGWYMSTEIAMRNFTDIQRYNLTEKIANLMGLDTNTYLSCWKEKVQTLLNEALLYSFNKNRVSMVD